MTKTEQLNKAIKLDEIKLRQLKTQKAQLKNQLRNVCDQIRATKAQRRFHRGQVKTVQKMDILDQAIRDLR